MESFIEALSKHPKDYYLSRAFELEITSFVKSNAIEQTDLNYLKSVLESDSNDAFLGFFILFTYYRRQHQLEALKDLYDKHFKRFDSKVYPILCHLEFLYRATTEKDRYQLGVLVSDMKEKLSLDVFKHHVGMVHHYCELIALLGEIDESYKTLKQDDIRFAYEQINEIIKIETYPKFFLTKARLELLLSLFDEAINNIELSIRYEDTKSKDYLLTINKLNDYKLRANLLKMKHENKLELEDFKKTKEQMHIELEETTRKMETNNIKVIALFSTLIGLVIGNVTLAASETANPMNLMLAFTGSVFMVLGIILSVITTLGFQSTTTKRQKWFSYIIITLTIILGVLMMLAASRRG